MSFAREKCNKIALSDHIESAYGTALALGDLDQGFEPKQVILPEPEQEFATNEDEINGTDFATDAANVAVLTKDLRIPFVFPVSLELLGIIFSLGTNSDAVSGVGPYTHIFKPQSLCGTGAFPSSGAMLGFAGRTATYQQVKGLVPSEFGLRYTERGRGEVFGTFLTDGSFTPQVGYSFPASSAAINYIESNLLEIETGDTGGALSSIKSTFVGMEFQHNNNIDVDGARQLIAVNSTGLLPDAEPGNRSVSLSLTVQADPLGTAYETDFQSAQEKEIKLTGTIVAVTTEFILHIRSAIIESLRPRFNGLRPVKEITYKVFENSTDSAPWTMTVYNSVASYLNAAT